MALWAGADKSGPIGYRRREYAELSLISRCRTGRRGLDDRWIFSCFLFLIRNGLRWRDALAEYG